MRSVYVDAFVAHFIKNSEQSLFNKCYGTVTAYNKQKPIVDGNNRRRYKLD